MRIRILAAVLTAVFLIGTYGMVTAYAMGGPEEPGDISGEVQNWGTAHNTPPPVIPETPTPQPLTPPGTGTVVDNVTNENSIEFFTVTSAAGNIFFLIVDRQRDSENVYFLNAVTERDLLALAEESGEDWITPGITSTPPPIIPGIPDTHTPPNVDAEAEPELEPEYVPDLEYEQEPEQSGGRGMIILLIILAIGGGAAGYYFKILRPKQQAQGDAGDDYSDYDDDYTVEAEDTEDDSPPWDIDETHSHRDSEE